MKRALSALVAFAAFATMTSLASAAHADEPEPPPPPEPERAAPIAKCDSIGPKNAISTEPLALAARGIGLSYERLIGPPIFSVAALVGGRSAALGDYSSLTMSGGLEGRAWAHVGYRGCGQIAMSGLYLGLRLSAAYTRMSDKTDDHFVGSSVALASMVTLGWRFIAWRLLEVTPSIAGGIRSDVDPQAGLGTSARPAFALGLQVGWVF